VNSHYEQVLEELKAKIRRLASEYIIELYYILRNEEKYSSDDCRTRITNDCSDIWTKSTIEKYLPQEAKNVAKRKAGLISAQVKKKRERKGTEILVAVGEDDLHPTSVEMDSTENSSNWQEKQESWPNAKSYCVKCDEKNSSIRRLESDIEWKKIQVEFLKAWNSQLEGKQKASDGSESIKFSHHIHFEELQSQMDLIFKQTHGVGDVWLSGKLEINSLKVMDLTVNATQPEITEDLASSNRPEN
jgi:hypothetical protein